MHRNKYEQLMERKLTRKQFLLMSVSLLLLVTGLSRVKELFGPPERKTGFGSGPYGGKGGRS